MNRFKKNKLETIRKAFKFRLKPTKLQEKKLEGYIGTCRFLYNAALEHRETCYRDFKKTIYYSEQQNQLPELKKIPELIWIKETPSQSLQAVLLNLEKAYINFFRGMGKYPKFKRKGRNNDSITFPQILKIKLVKISNKSFKVFGIPKFKDGLKFVYHREIEGKVKSATITRTGDEWYISFSCDTGEIIKKKPINQSSSAVGTDLGIVKTICTDEEDYNLNIEKIRGIEKEISILQRRKAKTLKFGEKWKYFSKIINSKQRKIKRIRHDFLHKVSYDICKNHTIVCLDDLSVKNMSKSASGTLEEPGMKVAQKTGLNRSILRQGWGIFNQFCEYKTAWNGGTIVFVPPQNSSRTCSNLDCGHVNVENRKTQADFHCVKCGFEENADRNAAKNNKRAGLCSLGLIPLEAPTITVIEV